MSIATRLNLLIGIFTLIAVTVLTVFIGRREYAYHLDELVLKATTQVSSQPQLQLTLYYREPVDVDLTLEQLLDLAPAVRQATIRDTLGEVIAYKAPAWAGREAPAHFDDLRGNTSPLTQSVTLLESTVLPPGYEAVGRMTGGEKIIVLTLPVVSVVNPTKAGLSRGDFGAALVTARQANSTFVIGYVEIGVSSSIIWGQTLPAIILSSAIGILFILLCAIIARFMTRGITAPLGNLARVAEDIATGKQAQMIKLSGTEEIREIANVLNGIISGMQTEKLKMHADRQLLELKVGERDAQLSQREEALHQAVATVSETKERLRHAAYFDALTSLPNRRLFTEQLGLLLRLAARKNEMVALVVVNLDNFKRINDSLGHKAGDGLLREVAVRLANSIRDSDMMTRNVNDEPSLIDLSRMGGDEFTIVLNELDSLEGAELVARRLSDGLTDPYHINDQEVIISCSVGISVAPIHAEDVEGLLRTANAAMVNAKKDGRNRCLMYNQEMESDNLERLRLETHLRKAIKLDQLELHYQPQVDAETGTVVGAEALIRWDHPEMGMVPPGRFVPLAEELGIIYEMGDWVLRQACSDIKRFRAEGLQLPKVSVNISALQVNETFVNSVAGAVADAGIPPDSLELELTEGIMIDNESSTLSIINDLRDVGVRISIDDFGTGFSSLSYLTRLPLHELKIDRSFVVGLAKGERNRELVRGIIAMAKSLHLDLVVEGVESPEQLAFFRQLSVSVIQGYLFSPAVTAEKLRPMLETGYFSQQVTRLERKMANAAIPLERA